MTTGRDSKFIRLYYLLSLLIHFPDLSLSLSRSLAHTGMGNGNNKAPNPKSNNSVVGGSSAAFRSPEKEQSQQKLASSVRLESNRLENSQLLARQDPVVEPERSVVLGSGVNLFERLSAPTNRDAVFFTHQEQTRELLYRYDISTQLCVPIVPNFEIPLEASIILQGNSLVISGGLDLDKHSLKKLIIYDISLNAAVFQTEMPIALHRHCTLIHQRGLYFIGGKCDKQLSRQCFKLDLVTKEFVIDLITSPGLAPELAFNIAHLPSFYLRLSLTPANRCTPPSG